MGGHVGIQLDSNQILNFVHRGSFHIISNKRNKKGFFKLTTQEKFNSILGGNCNQVKTVTILIPVNDQQLRKLDSLAKTYLKESPYDYAFFGVRCAAASYEILSQLDIFDRCSHTTAARKIFYPRLLRKELLKRAGESGWTVIRQPGIDHRIWETD